MFFIPKFAVTHTLDVLVLLPDTEASVLSQRVAAVCCCVHLRAVPGAVTAQDCLLSACEVKPTSALHTLFFCTMPFWCYSLKGKSEKKNGFTGPIQ